MGCGTGTSTENYKSAARDYTQTNTRGTTLAAAASCTVPVVFKPTAAGARTGTLSIADHATGSPRTVALTGTPQVTLSAITLLIPHHHHRRHHHRPESHRDQLPGNAALTIGFISVKGTTPGDFPRTNTCGAGLAASASCTISVTFKPTARIHRSPRSA
jgi:hypothetical protein